MGRIEKFFMRAVSVAALVILFPTTDLSAGDSYEYDANGRLTKVTYADGSTISYSYDANGNILAIDVVAPNRAPSVSALPDLSFPEDSLFTLPLDGFVTDVDNTRAEMTWAATVVGNSSSASTASTRTETADSLAVSIDNSSRVATFSGMPNFFTTAPIPVVFTATDPGGLSSSDTMEVTITAVNDAPLVSGMPDVSFPEDSLFTLPLDPFVADVDNAATEMVWAASVLEGMISESSEGSDKETPKNTMSFLHMQESPGRVHQTRETPAFAGVTGKRSTHWSAASRDGRRTVLYLSNPLSQTATDSLVITIDSTTRVATFSGTPNFFGLDIPVQFSAADPEGLADADTVVVSVRGVNDLPVVSGLPDVTFPEDSSRTLALDGFASDVDNSDEELTWRAVVLSSNSAQNSESGAAQVLSDLDVTVDNQTRTVTFTGAENFFTTEPISVALTATDPGGLSDSDTLSVTITAVNDGPSAFSRLLPEDGAVLEPEAVQLSWSRAQDVENDTVTYALALGFSQMDTTFTTRDTSLSLDFRTFGLSPGQVTVTWTVNASDGLANTAASNGEGSFSVDIATSVENPDPNGIPTEFALVQNYPNPFNPSTQIKFQLPVRAKVRLTLYNVLGRLVRTLVDEERPPGFYSVQWDGLTEFGERAASGVYVYRLEARGKGLASFAQTKKMLLLK